MHRIESQQVKIGGRIFTRHIYFPDFGGAYVRWNRVWNRVTRDSGDLYQEADWLIEVDVDALDRQVEETFRKMPPPQIEGE